MAMIPIDQFNPANGHVADGCRVQFNDGSVARLASVSGGWLLIHEGVEYGPVGSSWQVLDELMRIEYGRHSENATSTTSESRGQHAA